MSRITRRKFIGSLVGVALSFPLIVICKGVLSLNKEIGLSVVLYSYVNRPIFDVLLNGSDIGLANSYGGGGIIAEAIPFGPQTLTWRLDGPKGTPRNGETVKVKNSLIVSKDKIPPKTRYLGVHIYPDDTAELTFSQYIPDRTPRGEEILAEARKMRDNGSL